MSEKEHTDDKEGDKDGDADPDASSKPARRREGSAARGERKRRPRPDASTRKGAKAEDATDLPRTGAISNDAPGDETVRTAEGDEASPPAPRRGAKRKRTDDLASAVAGEAPPEDEAEDEDLLPVGNPLRPLRGGIALVAGAFVAFCLMAVVGQYRYGVPIAALAVLVATFGVLDLAGTFDDPDDRIAGRATLSTLARPLGLFLGGAASLWGIITLAVDGRLSASYPVLASGILVPAAFLITIVGAYQVADAFGAWTADEGETEVRPLHKRHGFWLIVFATLLYLPLLGSHSLSDPWETHYGEVSREMLSRNDWISTWWAQEGWFFSKPVLDFWMQALAMATFGVRFKPDAMLSAVTEGRVPWPEWAVRLPVFLLSLIAVYLLYKAVAGAFGRRAGMLGGVVLLTMPQWFLLTHQTMTDMPFAAPMASAMALVILSLQEDPEREVKVYELSLGPVSLRFSFFHLVMGVIVACALPQILYLLSRNVLLDSRGFHTQLDSFMAGSAGNCGLPGNEACRAMTPVVHGLHPALQALIWAQALALVIYLNWGERRRQRLYLLLAWLFLGLSIMAKVLAGVAPVVVCMGLYVLYLIAAGRWRELLRFEIASGILILLAVAFPWYVAMYVRHGQPFTDRIIFHDMFKRAFTHVHDTNEGDDVSFRFYVWQLGYAMFPWTGLVPAALLYGLRRRETNDARSDAAVFLLLWFVSAFAIVSYMLTKFHHYILPALPPAAMLTGVLLDAMLERARPPAPATRPRTPLDLAVYGGGMLVGALASVWGAARLFAFSAAAPAARSVPAVVTGAGALVVGLSAFAASALLLGRVVMESSPTTGPDPASERLDDSARDYQRRFETIQLGAAGIAAAVVVLAVGRDLSANLEGLGNQIRLMHLVTYNYKRPWPTSLDFTPTLWAFTAVAAVLCVALVFAGARRHVVAGLVALGVVFGGWGVDVYLMKISPHWGQRETTLAYYQAARELPGPFVAYQMNWKGENFYTGNHVPAFVSSGKKFQDYVLEEKKKGVRTFYFVTEHGRTGTLSNELGQTREFEKLTTPELDNKFVLVRARFD
jgi:4-amino-4-deoxy-L-arabinose transferase-like glycosyltransferase